MRPTTSAFNTEAAKKQNRPIELLDLFFGSQTADDAATLHYAIWDDYVNFFSVDGFSKTYTPIGVRRSEVTNVMDNEQRQVTLEIDNVNRAFQVIFFQNADFMRDKRVVLRHVFQDALSAAANAVVVIDGLISSIRITETVCQLDIVGTIGQLQFKTGRYLDRICPLNFAGALCAYGVSAATLLQAQTDTVAAGSTATSVILSTVNKPDKYYAVGTMLFNNGQNAGYTRKVIGWTQSTKTAVLDFALPFAPAAGDSVTIQRDCDKSLADCRTRYTEIDATYGNTPNIHGFNTVVQTVN